VFSDAYKSSLSVIFIDDIERILDFTPVGMRFSNAVLQTLIVLLRRQPPTEGRRLLIFATTSIAHLLDDLQLSTAFNVTVHISQLQEAEEYSKVLQEASGFR
jgi:vesicle-fusing ATPase